MTQINRNPSISDRERASASDSKTRIKGSVTVESALTIPLFLFAVMCLVYLLEIQAIRFSIGTAVHGAAKIAAEDAAIHPFFNPVKFQADLVNLAEANGWTGALYQEEAAVSAVGRHIMIRTTKCCTLKFRINCSFRFLNIQGSG